MILCAPKELGPVLLDPLILLRRHGIEYIELRGVDVNPFVPEGISLNNIKVLDLFLMHSLISESPSYLRQRSDEIRVNQIKMVEHGRSDEVELTRAGLSLSLLK